jgi:RES domain-containing protein
MVVFRITHYLFANTLFASGISGRWNGEGKKVIYTSESVAVALLENMARRRGLGFGSSFRIMLIEIPDTIERTEIKAGSLYPNWRSPHDYSFCQPSGNAWYDSGKTAVLKVPSSIIDGNNYVINTLHPDFSRIRIIGTVAFEPDERIEDILKGYKRTEK